MANPMFEPTVLAIGECGLDANRRHKDDLAIFEAHIYLAEKLQKPLIIHCVKRHNDLINTKKRLKVSVPMIVHGFNNKRAIADSLLENGFYLSFGAAILLEKSNSATVFPTIPAVRIFLETDDSVADIGLIYGKAAALRHISVAAMRLLVEQNVRSVFAVF
jgi:TatD DNase family protein